jgi:hypothetical protein
MLRTINVLGGSKFTLFLISLIAIITVIDSQFIKVFYGTDLGSPGNFQLLLFVSLVIFASVINIAFIRFAKSNDTQAQSSRPLLFKITYICTFGIQMAVLLITYSVIFEMFIFHAYDRVFLLLVVIVSHFLSAFILGMLSVIFLQWLRHRRSLSILTYALVFIVIVFLILSTLALLMETHSTQSTLESESVSPMPYITLVLQDVFPSTVDPNIAFVYGLGTYALPIMTIASWLLTVSLLKGYTNRIGKKRFWLVVSIPLAYQIFVLVVSDPNLVTDPNMVEILYSPQVQFLVAINGQISGLFFAVTLWTFGRKSGQKSMKIFFIISSLGIISLFSSIQPGSPFYEAYPPFGLPTLSFLGLSSYMLLVGIVGSAAYVARDNAVRHEMYNSLEGDSHVLKMATAEMQRELEHRVLSFTKKIKSSEFADDMKFTADPDEKDVRLMVEEVLKEVHSKGRLEKNNR